MTSPVAELEKHYTSSVIIINDTLPAKTLLIHHRKYDKWMPPGGHQENHENPVETAIREAQEETGVDITDAIEALKPFDQDVSHIPKPHYFLEETVPAHGDQPRHFHLDHVYVVHIPEQSVSHNLSESHDIGWFTLAETEKLTTFDNVHHILRQELAS